MKSAASRLRAALAAVLVPADAPELALVHQWLDNWRGVGMLAIGLHRVGYDLDLRQYGDGRWRAPSTSPASLTASSVAQHGSRRYGVPFNGRVGMR